MSAVLLSTALLLLGQTERETHEEILQNLDSYLERWVEEYVPYIITDSERTVFETLESPETRLAFIDTFWRRRDPTLGTPENEFRDAYAERFAYANNRFRTVRPGWKTDRGRIYILLGPPASIDRSPLGRTSTSRPSEIWTYMGLKHPELPSSIDIHFVDFRGDGEFEIVSNVNAADLSPAGFLPAYSDLDYFGQRRAFPFEFTDAGQQRVDEGDLAFDQFNFMQDILAAESPPEAAPQPLSAVVGTDFTFSALPFDLQIFTTRGSEADGLVSVALALRYDNLAARSSGGRHQFSLDVYAELRASDPMPADKLDQQLNFTLTEEEARALSSESLRYFFSLSAPSGDYTLHFVVRNNVGGSVGRQEVPVHISARTSALDTSSIILADDVSGLDPEEIVAQAGQPGSPFLFADTKVLPNTSAVFARGAPMHVYYQVYGLSLRDGRNSLRVSYTFLRAGKPLWEPMGVYVAPTDQENRAVTSTFDTSRFPAGRYQMIVDVEDLVAAATIRREAFFFVR